MVDSHGSRYDGDVYWDMHDKVRQAVIRSSSKLQDPFIP